MSESDPDDSCCICIQKMMNPRRLPCNHVLCVDCVRDIIKHEERRYSLSCPLCRRTYALAVAPGEASEQPTYVKDIYRTSIEEIPGNNVLKHDGKVMGMAILDDKLFVICKSPPNIVYGYDVWAEAMQSKKPVEVNIPDMVWPRGMAVNESLNSLYISEWSKMFGGRLWKYKNSTTGDICKINLDIQPFGVSVSPRNDRILVSCATPINIFATKGWIYVYQDLDKDLGLVTKLELQDIEIPRHALHTDSSKYLVCHGWTTKSHGVTSYREDELGRVIKTDFYGSASGGGNSEMEMYKPLSMALDEDGLVLAVDYHNHRIQLLTEDLRMVRHLVTKEEHEIKYPRQVCIHPKLGRMYVGQEDGTVHVFHVRI